MNRKASLSATGYHLLHTLLLSAIFLLCAGTYAGIRTPGAGHFIVAFCTISIFTLFSVLNAKYRLFAGLFIMVMLVCFALAIGMDTSFRFVQSYLQWLVNSGDWQPEWQKGYENIQTIVSVFIVCLVEVLLEKQKKLRPVPAAILFAGLLLALFMKKTLPHAGVVCIFFYIVLALMEWIQLYWKKHRRGDSKRHTLRVLPFLGIYFILLMFTPAPKEPYDWQFVKDAYHQIQSAFSRIVDFAWGRGGDGIGTALSGFSEDGLLHDSFTSNVREVMQIDGQISLVTNIYLSGKTFDTFDGTQWLQTDKNAPTIQVDDKDTFIGSSIQEDTAKTVLAVETHGPLALKNYLSKTTLLITYVKYDADTLFLPLKSERVREKDESYEVVYYQMNMDAPPFYEMLTEAQATTTTDNFAGRELYAKEVILSDEVRNYLDTITANAENDIEKLKLLEEELSSFTYNQAPGALPDYVTDESSFLDYFLLESREGFCTHFATAFVLLARAEGIPARYVQGFCIPTRGEETITVYSNMAHAWPEVYIDGVGFIPFEPTPGYHVMRYTPWKITTAGIDISGSGATYRPEITIPKMTEETESIPEDNRIPLAFLKILAFILPTVALIAITIWFLGKLGKKYRYKKMSPAEKLQTEAAVTFRLLELLGTRRADNETLEEFSLQVKQLSEYQVEMTQFITLYENVIYGKKEVSDEMVAFTKTTQKLLFDAVKRKSTLLYLFMLFQFYPYSAL